MLLLAAPIGRVSGREATGEGGQAAPATFEKGKLAFLSDLPPPVPGLVVMGTAAAVADLLRREAGAFSYFH
jgi:hypothetical protein